MTGVAQEGAGVCKHSHKTAQHAVAGKIRQLLAHTGAVIIEPPCAALLELTGHTTALKTGKDSGNGSIVIGIQ